MDKILETLAEEFGWSDETTEALSRVVSDSEELEPFLAEIAEDRGWDPDAFTAYVVDVTGYDRLESALKDFPTALVSEETFSSLGEFIDTYNEEVYGSEYTEWLDKARQFGYLVPNWREDVDETAVGQDFTLTTSGYVFRNV